jgi:hypothetical protein
MRSDRQRVPVRREAPERSFCVPDDDWSTSAEAPIWRYPHDATARRSGADDLCSRSGAFRVFVKCARSADMARVNQPRRTGTTGSDATRGAVRIGPRRRWPPTWLPLSRWPIPTPDGTGRCDRGPLEARAQWRGGIRTRGPCVRRRWQPTQAQPPSSPDEQRQCRARSRRARSHQVPPWLSPCVDSNELDLVQSLPRMPAACGSCRSDRQRRTTWREIGRSVSIARPLASRRRPIGRHGRLAALQCLVDG